MKDIKWGDRIPNSRNSYMDIHLEDLDMDNVHGNIRELVSHGGFNTIFPILSNSDILIINIFLDDDVETYELKEKTYKDLKGFIFTQLSKEGDKTIFVSTSKVVDEKITLVVPRDDLTFEPKEVFGILSIIANKLNSEYDVGRVPYINRVSESKMITIDEFNNNHNLVMFKTVN